MPNVLQKTTTKKSMRNTDYISPADFLAWQKVNAVMLRDNEELQRRAIDDAVIKSMMHAMQAGFDLHAAGDWLVRCFHYGCRDGINYTPAAVRRALRSIGWLPKRERAGGAE
ncbi:hypothetical protein ACNRBH_23785 [Ralstonia pseudosolanacearum]|uniref:hypothetical protein n=1 Tax=Ralstonia pseudosolanacearum TaxID=1310165 RepID=UPI003AAA8683